MVALCASTFAGLGACASLFLPVIEFQDYDKPFIESDRGRLRVGLEPERSMQRRDGRDVRVYAAPYRFNAQYTTGGQALTLYRGELRNVRVRSANIGELVFEADVIHDVRKSLRDAGSDNGNLVALLGFGQGGLNIAYHDYEVELDYVIYDVNAVVYDQGHVRMVIEKDFYRARNRRGTVIL